MAVPIRAYTREIIASLLALLAPALYFIFTETSKAPPYQITAGHGLLLITLPVGLVLVWLIERRPSSQVRQPTPVWARLLLGGATGLLLATAMLIVNAFTLRDVTELPGTSLGTRPEPGLIASHAVVELKDGRTVHLLNAFCGVTGSPVTVSFAKGLLGLERLVSCTLPSMRPPKTESPKNGTK
jgi:hypothetical protein